MNESKTFDSIRYKANSVSEYEYNIHVYHWKAEILC